MNTFLSIQEIETITGYKRIGDQKRQLTRCGIPYKTNTRNRLVVLREHVVHWLEGKPSVKNNVPNLALVR